MSVATVYTGMSVLYVATSDHPMEKVNRGNSPETGTRLATVLRIPPFSACKKGIEDVCSLHASYDGDCYRIFSIIVHYRARLKYKMMKNKVALMMLRIFCETHAYFL